MAKRHRPRRGSLAFSPRKRARSQIPHIRTKTIVGGEKSPIVEFSGYKAGMTHLIMIEDNPNAPNAGMEVAVPVTVIETPPMKLIGIRGYGKGLYGKRPLMEVWDGKEGHDSRLEAMAQAIEDGSITELRAIASTQPRLVGGIGKKKPDIMEQRVDGDLKGAFEYLRSNLGGEITVSSIFEEGEMVDVIAITKGKGTQGPVKRWGTAIQDRKARRSSKGRHIGTLGPWNPHRVRWTVPQLGQTGYHQRTEYNKRVLKLGRKDEDINPKGGFPHYGLVRNDYIILKGSVPGPRKRLIRIRHAIRPTKVLKGAPQITYISKESKQ
ncbi:MAG TPA: 50S ribosomal protein L3 [Candidatus Syntrophoarchaeum butanivorans]|uniref:Large ribosomal subunit protein uL3 n=1 Tax=Candidatus Syntropharchaeum butanivorans TaxID=1839936 RepID=A0A7J2S2T1_9EURY|nr:50S ribosomal protein L3 [Candidatus Syntrophoarchaeum butanivorans]